MVNAQKLQGESGTSSIRTEETIARQALAAIYKIKQLHAHLIELEESVGKATESTTILDFFSGLERLFGKLKQVLIAVKNQQWKPLAAARPLLEGVRITCLRIAARMRSAKEGYGYILRDIVPELRDSSILIRDLKQMESELDDMLIGEKSRGNIIAPKKIEIVKRQIRIVHFENREGRNLLRNIRELFETIEQQARRLTVKILPNIEHGLETFEHERYQENMGRIIGRTATLTQVIQFLDGMITAVSSCLLAKPEAQKFFEAHDKLVRTTTTLNEAIDRELRGIVELEKADNYWKELIG